MPKIKNYLFQSCFLLSSLGCWWLHRNHRRSIMKTAPGTGHNEQQLGQQKESVVAAFCRISQSFHSTTHQVELVSFAPLIAWWQAQVELEGGDVEWFHMDQIRSCDPSPSRVQSPASQAHPLLEPRLKPRLEPAPLLVSLAALRPLAWLWLPEFPAQQQLQQSWGGGIPAAAALAAGIALAEAVSPKRRRKED